MANIKITLKGSVIGRTKGQKETVKSLGFAKLGQTKILPDNPAVRGAIYKVSHLLEWEEVA